MNILRQTILLIRFKFFAFRPKKRPKISKDLYMNAITLAFNSTVTSASYMQRIMRLKFSTAAEIMRLLQRDGLIAPEGERNVMYAQKHNIIQYRHNHMIETFSQDNK
jgi:hypothetical protein